MCWGERKRGKKEGHMDAIEGWWTDDVISQSGYRAPGKAATTHKTCFFFLKYIQTPSTQHINWSACFWDTPRQVKNLCSMVMVKCLVKLILQTEGVILADWMVIEDFSLRAHTHTLLPISLFGIATQWPHLQWAELQKKKTHTQTHMFTHTHTHRSRACTVPYKDLLMM